MSIAELDVWLQDPDPKKFPYSALVREFHLVGKHFVAPELLAALDRARATLPRLNSPWSDVRTLAMFLSTALDKPDNDYDYPTYLALSLLQLPTVDDPVEHAMFARSRCDRLSVQLLADVFRFELAVADGHTNLLPDMRPDPALVVKRYRLGIRVAKPALARLGLDSKVTATDPVHAARQVCAVVAADSSFSERQAIELSILPVYTAHDEYLFLRVLQLFEMTFALLAVKLRAVIHALGRGEADRAVHFLDTTASALRESAPLFSMLATMQVESFRTFRNFTEGASAIQSRNYKIVESLCRRPGQERLDSPAYHSVPEVRDRVLAGQPTLDGALDAARADDRFSAQDIERLTEAMKEFARALLRWRQTHYRLAVRMLGDKSGTGYTEGTPYLDSVRTIPVFESVDAALTDDPTQKKYEVVQA